MSPELKVAVGMSRKWDAYEAGREVARDTLDRLGKKPDFFLLFCTIHYRDHGGFKKFLKGIWEVLPEGTSLVGGTVTGFINPRGCFIRGAVAIAASSPEMDVSVGCGKNTKRNPEKAAKDCTGMIEKGLANSKHSERFLLNLVSGSMAIKIPGYGYRKVIDSSLISKSISRTVSISQYMLQRGFGREDEVFERVVKKLPDYHMILGTCIGSFKGITNYQFFNDSIMTNSIVALGMATDMNLDVCTTHGMKRTDIKFEITKLSKDSHIIKEINGKPAVPELYRLLNWPKNFLNEENIYERILYYPISLVKHGREVPVVMPFIFKDYLGIPCRADKGEAWIMTVSGKNLLKALEDNLNSFSSMQPEFGLFSACITILQALGNNVRKIREILLKYFKDKPFLMLFCAGEGTYSPKMGLSYANMSYNTAMFGYNRNEVKL